MNKAIHILKNKHQSETALPYEAMKGKRPKDFDLEIQQFSYSKQIREKLVQRELTDVTFTEKQQGVDNEHLLGK